MPPVSAGVSEPRCVTREEAAEFLGITRTEFDASIAEGRIPGAIPGTRRWDMKAIKAALAKGYWTEEGRWLGAQKEDAERFPHHKVYFIGSGRAIKIGFSGTPYQRLDALQAAHHEELVMLGWIQGHEATERFLHRKFAEERIRGEWFRSTARLRRFIEKNRSDVSRL